LFGLSRIAGYDAPVSTIFGKAGDPVGRFHDGKVYDRGQYCRGRIQDSKVYDSGGFCVGHFQDDKVYDRGGYCAGQVKDSIVHDRSGARIGHVDHSDQLAAGATLLLLLTEDNA
jgi:hypothetical protein